MDIKPVIKHHPAYTVIGFSAVFKQHEGFEKCPKFWDEAYSGRYAHLFQTMKATNAEEQAVLDNHIGEYAVCRAVPEQDAFEYMICGGYQGGTVPEGMKLYTIPESDWLEFRTHGPLPDALQKLSSYVHQTWMPEHAKDYHCRGLDIEYYSAGNPADASYESGVFMPIIWNEK